MTTKYGFLLFTPDEFVAWLPQQQVARTVLYVQEPQTYIPNYTHFKGNNHLEMQKGMHYVHKAINGWADIAQHFTILPDGMIGLEMNAPCITGFNENVICTENLGNFDLRGDAMCPEHREAILRVTAALCKRFGIPANANPTASFRPADRRAPQRRRGDQILARVTKSWKCCSKANPFSSLANGENGSKSVSTNAGWRKAL